MEIRHVSVLLKEVLDFAPLQNGGLVVDATTGEGGHSLAILERYPMVHLACIDADVEIQKKAKVRLAPWNDRVEFYLNWFDQWFEGWNGERPQFILMDLGISIFHYEESGRGFSFQNDEILDMRLSPSAGASAEDLINNLEEDDLANLIWRYAEESQSRRIARAIVKTRKVERIQSAKKLAEIIWEAVPPNFRYGRIHPATKTFQALRIAVNGELDRLSKALGKAFEILQPGGRLAVISFHSLEDRPVKTAFRELAKVCICPENQPRCSCSRLPLAKDLTRKPVTASSEECSSNPPSRSAKLRVIEKLRDTRDLKGDESNES